MRLLFYSIYSLWRGGNEGRTVNTAMLTYRICLVNQNKEFKQGAEWTTITEMVREAIKHFIAGLSIFHLTEFETRHWNKNPPNIIILLFFSIFLGTLKASDSGAGWEGRTVDPSHLSASSLSCHSSCAWRGVALQIILSQTDRISRALLAEGN